MGGLITGSTTEVGAPCLLRAPATASTVSAEASIPFE